MSLNLAVPSADGFFAKPGAQTQTLQPNRACVVHAKLKWQNSGNFCQKPGFKNGGKPDHVHMHGKTRFTPQPPFSAIMGRTCILAPVTVSPQFMAYSCECHTILNMSPRRVDRGDLRPYLSLTVSRKTWPFRQDSEANRP